MMHPEIYQQPVDSDEILSIQKSLQESGYLLTSGVVQGMSPDWKIRHNRPPDFNFQRLGCFGLL